MPRDPVQPSAFVAGPVKPVPSTERVVEGVLQQVLGERPVANHRDEVAAELGRVLPEQDLEPFGRGSLWDGRTDAHTGKMPQPGEM
jgi:hypothetical protein